MIKKIIPCLSLLPLVGLSCCFPVSNRNTGSTYCHKKEIKIQCSKIQKEVLYYWPADSLGENGFRIVVADLLIKCKCFIGFNWVEVEKKLGKPNFDEPLVDGSIKSYTLVPEYQYLVIFVNEKNIVYNLTIRVRDG